MSDDRKAPFGKRPLPLDKHRWHPSPLPGQVVLVTTVDTEGRLNVATKSWISMAAFGPPPVVMFGCNLDHATARNALDGEEFVINVPGDDLAEVCWNVGTDQAVRGEDRFAANGLTPIPAERTQAPRIAECRAHLECELDSHRTWGKEVAIFGCVVAASVDGVLLEGDRESRYQALAPIFFLEGRLTAMLGPTRRIERSPFRGSAREASS